MTTTVDQAAVVEPHSIQGVATVMAASSTASTAKVSMFKGKSGFVIPKNKLSGSLVPVFKGVKKPEDSDAAHEESTKLAQRKTKWGPDLTQDAAVRKGRALAYQIRVDQIAQLLKSGSLSSDNEDTEWAADVPVDGLPSDKIDYEKLQHLELERREAIGEILKLNPSFKAPSDYVPLLREATVPIPVKEHPEYNFVGLVLGPGRDTQKRLEKETGARIQVFGIKSETGEKVEITASDGTEVLSSCTEVYVQISADSYEKVDAAVPLIELLVASVSGKSASSKTLDSASGVTKPVASEGQDSAASAAAVSQVLVQPIVGPMSTLSQGHFPSHPRPWMPAASGSPGLPFVPNLSMSAINSSLYPSLFPHNPTSTQPSFAPRHGPMPGFVSSSQSAPVMLLPSSQPPMQVMQRSFVPPAYSFGQVFPPRNPSGPAPRSSLAHSNISALSSHPSAPGPPSNALGPVNSSVLRPVSVSTITSPLSASAPTLSGPPAPPSPVPSPVTLGEARFMPPHIRSSSALPGHPFPPQASSGLGSAQVPSPAPSMPRPPHSGMPGSLSGGVPVTSFTQLNSIAGVAPRSQLLPSSGNFTFQPHRPQAPLSQSVSGPGHQSASQRPLLVQSSPASQMPPFRPPLPNAASQPLMQNFQRPQIGDQMGHRLLLRAAAIAGNLAQLPPPSSNPQMGPRNLGPAPQMLNMTGPFAPRPGNLAQFQQGGAAPPLGRPGNPFTGNQHLAGNPPFTAGRTAGGHQSYDPFSPNSAPAAARLQGSNGSNVRKQESDPEYEDLMASVGVK